MPETDPSTSSPSVELISASLGGGIPRSDQSYPPVKPGWQTTEFWLTLLAMIGSIASEIGHVLPGKWAAGFLMGSAIAYAISRGMVKKAAVSSFLWVALLLPALLFSSCASITPATQEKFYATGSYVVQKAAAIAVNTVLNGLTSPSDQTVKANYVDGLASAFWSQTTITGADVKALVSIWCPDRPQWTALGDALAAKVDGGELTADSIAAGLNKAAAEKEQGRR